jgi:hypothetical protein
MIELLDTDIKHFYSHKDKAIIASYYIKEDGDNYIITNVRLMPEEGKVFADNAIPYYITSAAEIKIGKSFVKILGDSQLFENFKYVKIPYYVFKKYGKQLYVNRYIEVNPKFRRFTVMRKQEDFFKNLDLTENLDWYFKNVVAYNQEDYEKIIWLIKEYFLN